MTTNLYIDIWNEPDGFGFWPRSQDQYLQAWDYAYDRYRSALGSAILVGPSTASQPALDNGWWTNYANHIKGNNKVSFGIMRYTSVLCRRLTSLQIDPRLVQRPSVEWP